MEIRGWGVQGHSLCRAASRSAALARAATARAMVRYSGSRWIWQRLHAAARTQTRPGECRGRSIGFAKDERGLPVLERLDLGRPRRRAPSRDDLDLWRRLP